MKLQIRDTKRGRLTNYMEVLADDVLRGMVSKGKGRYSETSLEDIKALALNRLWPMYTTTAVGKGFIRQVIVEDHVEKDVARELRAAMSIVKANPRA